MLFDTYTRYWAYKLTWHARKICMFKILFRETYTHFKMLSYCQSTQLDKTKLFEAENLKQNIIHSYVDEGFSINEAKVILNSFGIIC